jgi:hypothetical protein
MLVELRCIRNSAYGEGVSLATTLTLVTIYNDESIYSCSCYETDILTKSSDDMQASVSMRASFSLKVCF